MSNEELLNRLREALAGEASYEEVEEITHQLVASGADPLAAIDVATGALHVIGEQFAAFEVFLPDLMIAGEKMKRAMALLQPHIVAGSGRQAGGRVVLGTVSGDLHDIGKNLVATMLTVGGFEVTDLGINVPPLEFVKAAREQRANVLALSSLMTASLPYQKETIDLLREMGQRDKYYVIVGGGPVTPEFAQSIGADGWAENAALAAELCRRLIQSGQAPATQTLMVQ
jgi:5-methyltetrahydrofolate--homocysteine methyltransferase